MTKIVLYYTVWTFATLKGGHFNHTIHVTLLMSNKNKNIKKIFFAI